MSDTIIELRKRAQEMLRNRDKAQGKEDACLLEQAAREIESLRKQVRQLALGE
jgi:hypothetical protein